MTALREGPKALTGKQISALPGIAYRAFAQGLEDNPGLPAKGGSELRRQLTRQKEATLSSSPRMMQSDVSPEKAQGANFGLTVSHQISGLRQALRSRQREHIHTASLPRTDIPKLPSRLAWGVVTNPTNSEGSSMCLVPPVENSQLLADRSGRIANLIDGLAGSCGDRHPP